MSEGGAARWADAALAAALVAVDPVGTGGVALRALAGPARERWLALLAGLLPTGTPQRRLPLHATDGLRGELTLVRAARALAALEGAAAVGDAHLKRVAPSALRHRLRRNPLDDSGSTVRVERAVAELFGP